MNFGIWTPGYLDHWISRYIWFTWTRWKPWTIIWTSRFKRSSRVTWLEDLLALLAGDINKLLEGTNLKDKLRDFRTLMYPKLFYKPTGEIGINTANPEGALDVNMTKANLGGINIKRNEFNSRMSIDPSGTQVINMNKDTVLGTEGVKKLMLKVAMQTKGANSEFNLNNDDTSFSK